MNAPNYHCEAQQRLLSSMTRLADESISYALSKKIPDMRSRGVRIETSYGELDLDDELSNAVADLVEKAFLKRLKHKVTA